MKTTPPTSTSDSSHPAADGVRPSGDGGGVASATDGSSARTLRSAPLSFTGPRPRLAGDGPLPGQALDRSTGQSKHRLRLVGERSVVKPQRRDDDGTAIAGTADPRWVLAVRVAEQMQGSVLPPDRREKLIKLGRSFGLTPFDANLIIAIVQDQARRGYAPAYCPTAGEGQLRMVPLPHRRRSTARPLLIGAIITGVIAIELAVLALIF